MDFPTYIYLFIYIYIQILWICQKNTISKVNGLSFNPFLDIPSTGMTVQIYWLTVQNTFIRWCPIAKLMVYPNYSYDQKKAQMAYV